MTNIKNAFGNLKRVFTKAKKENELKLALGFSTAVLARGKAMSYKFNGKSGSADCEDRVLWKRKTKEVMLYPSREPNPHIIIVGMSGFGKSTLLRSMLGDISKSGTPTIIFDAHDEHESTVKALGGKVHDSSCSGVNIFDLDGYTVSARIAELATLLKSVYSLGYVQEMKLSQCMWYMYRKAGASGKESTTLTRTPTIKDLINELGIFVDNSRTPTDRNTLLHLKGRISQLDSPAFIGGFVGVSDLKHGINSFSLSSMKSEGMRLIYLHELLRRLYQDMKRNEKERGISMYIMIDEADFLISSTGSGSYMVNQLISEGRKYGVGVILATHTASDLDKQMVANTSTFISFYPREPFDVNYIANILSGGLPEESLSIKNKLHQLRVNEAIMISGRLRAPVLLRTRSAIMESERLPAMLEPVKRITATERALALAKKPIRFEKFVEKFGAADEASLFSIGIDCAMLDWKGAKERWLMKRKPGSSVELEAHVFKIAEELSKRGISNTIIDNACGPDLAARVNGKEIAIEYETGKKGIWPTICMLGRRLGNYDRVVVLVNDAHYDAYQKNVARSRISIFPASEMDRAINACAAMR